MQHCCYDVTLFLEKVESSGCLPVEDDMTRCEEHESVEELEDVVPGLVDGEYYGHSTRRQPI